MCVGQSRASAVAGGAALLVATGYLASCVFVDRLMRDEEAPAMHQELTVSEPEAPDVMRVGTRNGTMSVELPNGWSIDDRSTFFENYDEHQQWSNLLLLTAPTGVTIGYYDGSGDATDGRWEHFEVVESIETPSGHLAIAFWRQTDSGVTADVILGSLGIGGQPLDHVMHSGIGRTHAMGVGLGSGAAPRFPSVESARAFLDSAVAQEALSIIATVDLLPVPQYAIPAGSSGPAANDRSPSSNP